ncbi:MAG: starch-binding protein [Acutalibacteraceae bacterium]
MNKRNFILDFALKTKYNLFACIVALLVLVFSVSSFTYAWIEGATSLQIKTSDTDSITTIANTDRAVIVSAENQGDPAPETLHLSNYIDPSTCALAPARASLENATSPIVIKFLKDGATDFATDASYRPSDTNDISNNYIFFETKIKPKKKFSNYVFTGSSITLKSTTTNSVRIGVTVLDSARTVKSSKIFTSSEITAESVKATDGFAFEERTEYILQIKIWNEVTDTNYNELNAGQDAAINVNLIPQSDFVSVTFFDYTNSATSLKLTTGKTVKLEYGTDSVTFSSKSEKNNGLEYIFNEVPKSSLADAKVVTYDSSLNKIAEWSLADIDPNAIMPYYAYGGINDDLSGNGVFATEAGTSPLEKVTLIDKSYEKLLSSDTNVTISNGLTSYALYSASSTNFYAYAPAASTNYSFSNSTYYAEESTLTSGLTNPTYYIVGESPTSSDGKTKCVGFWNDGDNASFTTITIKDATPTSTVSGNANLTIYASYPNTVIANQPYKAYRDGTLWRLTALYNSYGTGAEGTWTFIANEGARPKYFWTMDDREADKLTYTFKTAVESTAQTSEGTWDIVESYVATQDILKGTKVSFYAGIQSTWAGDDLYLSNSSENGSSVIHTGYTNNITLSKATYKYNKIVEADPLDYYIKQNLDWSGEQFGQVAEGGKFYGLWSEGEGKESIESKVALTGSTTFDDGKDSTSESHATIYQGTQTINLQSVLLQQTSLFGEPLTVEYWIKASDATYYTFVGTADVESTTVTKDSVPVLSCTGTVGNSFEIATVISDGTVAYVADRDYVDVVAEPNKVTVALTAVDNADVTATSGSVIIAEGSAGSVYEGDVITVTAANLTTNYVMTGIKITNTSTGAEIKTETASSNSATYTVPADSPAITIEPVIVNNPMIRIYFDNSAKNWNPPYAHYWNSSQPTTFPGLQMTLVPGETNIYYIDIPDNAKNIIFSNGYSSNQTSDLTIDYPTYNMHNGTDWSTYKPKVSVTIQPNADADIVVKNGDAQIAKVTHTASSATTISVEEGSTITATATPISTAAKIAWNVTGSIGSADTTADQIAATSTYTIDSVTTDTTVQLTGVEKYYVLTVSKSGTGTFVVADATSIDANKFYVKSGATPTITATRNGSDPTRIQFNSETSVDLTSTVNTAGYTLPTAMTADTTVTISFTSLYKLTYSLVKTDATAATLTATVAGNPVASGTYYPAGTTVTFTASRPDDDNYYSVKFNRKDSTTAEGGSDTYCDSNLQNASETFEYTITAAQGDVTVTATVAKQEMRDVTITTPANASVTASYSFHNAVDASLSTGTSIKVPVGAEMTIKAKPYDDYSFTGYTVENATASTPVMNAEGQYVSTISVASGTEEITITANVYHNYLISVVQPDKGATISVVKKDTSDDLINSRVPKNTNITISIDLADNYTLSELKINGSAVADTPTGDPATYDYTVTADTTISVVLAKQEPTTRTIYFKNTANWSDVKIYYYGGTNGMTNFNDDQVAMKDLGDNLYSYDVPNDIEGVVFVGTVNTTTVQNDSNKEDPGDNNLFICDANSMSGSSNRYSGTWSVYDPSGSGGGSGDTSTWYLGGYINNTDYGIGCFKGFGFAFTQSTTNINEWTATFTADSDKETHYLTVNNGVDTTYGPNTDSASGISTAGVYSSVEGTANGKNKWQIENTAGKEVKVTLDTSTMKIKYEIVS